VPARHKVALVGPSGAGKTTLIRLLYRLYDLESGTISIDGADITRVTQSSLRDSLSMVPQECILFDDTLYNNIAFSNPRASRQAVFEAMRFAQLDKFIEGLPLREKTIVGERGVKLSGGEKQRVSIARALLADKRILVLDEATSSLDSETEHEIQKGLMGLMKVRTSLVIAHRLSTIMTADTIVVLDKGRAVQSGTHRQLIRKPGLYKRLWNLQKGGYIG
jgi:ATP-binding cassette subfamily B protein